MEDDSIAGTSSAATGDSMDTTTEIAEKFLGFADFSKFYEQFSLNIKETVSASTKIPLKQNELDYYMTCPAFKNFLQTQNERCLKIISTLLRQQGIKKTNINSAKLDDEERIDMIIDSNDQIIEKLGIQLDEIQGLRKKTETELKFSTTPLQLTSRNINTSWNKDMGMVVNKTLLQNMQRSGTKSGQSTANGTPGLEIKKGPVGKPQKAFEDKIDNSYLPFLSKLRHKHNQLVPLPEIYKQISEKDFQVTKETFETYPELLENPYQFEIDRIQVSDCYAHVDFKIQSPVNLENTPFKYIDDVEGLIWLVDHLGKSNRANVKEIAVDLEHHNYRSFMGFTCLMQISTRSDDFIVDTIKLRTEMHRLNEVFTDWTLVKVLHGADFDIEWLQKDFGIYVVNMFDTGQAARVLQYPHFSLSYLMQKFCGITAQKQYQLADWRQRPLSDAMIKYAREDTHYLLYIFDNLRDDLIKLQQRQLMHEESNVDLLGHISVVLEKSKAICKKVYRKPTFYTKGFLNLCQHNSHLNSKQTKALRDLYEWRDKIARETDESWEYVLKNHQLLKIAELLPREIYGIFALCNPLSSIVEANVHEILEVVKSAREFTGTLTALTNFPENDLNASATTNKPDAESQSSKSVLESIVHLTTYDPNSMINCAHDLPVDEENTDNQTMDAEQASVLSLSEILIRPSATKAAVTMPGSLMAETVSALTSIFSKDLHVKTEALLVKKIQMLEEKVKAIREEIENPFQMFLPNEFRQTSDSEKNKITKWCLLKPFKTQSKAVQSNETVQAKAEQTVSPTEEFMIPLKQQFRSEKKPQGKKRKNVDFTDAIIEYNRAKARVNALGGDNEEEMLNENQNDDIDTEIQEQQQKLDALVQQKITANLKLLSKETAAPGSSKKTNGNEEIYTYDAQSMNKLFAKPEVTRNEFDPASKIRNSKHSKVNKRRMTNAITRMKNNHSLTYKKDAPSNQGGNGGGGSSGNARN